MWCKSITTSCIIIVLSVSGIRLQFNFVRQTVFGSLNNSNKQMAKRWIDGKTLCQRVSEWFSSVTIAHRSNPLELCVCAAAAAAPAALIIIIHRIFNVINEPTKFDEIRWNEKWNLRNNNNNNHSQSTPYTPRVGVYCVRVISFRCRFFFFLFSFWFVLFFVSHSFVSDRRLLLFFFGRNILLLMLIFNFIALRVVDFWNRSGMDHRNAITVVRNSFQFSFRVCIWWHFNLQ